MNRLPHNPAQDTGLDQRIDVIRKFNRMYMQKIGILAENIFGSKFTAAEVRVLNEMSQWTETTATTLARDLNMDGGYLSRILNGFEKQGLLTKERSKEDARQRRLLLTKKGIKASSDLTDEARKIMLNIVSPLPVEEQIRLVAAMSTVDRIVNREQGGFRRTDRVQAPFIMRTHRIGDIGRIIHVHAVQFAADFGWNQEFEALVAEKAAEFIRNFNAAKDRCLIAEIDGHLVGSVILCGLPENGLGEIKLPYVAPEARGMGIGTALFTEILRFAKEAGYKKLTLRTEDAVDYASAMLEAAGMKIVKLTPHHCFGKDMVRQDWELNI
ncbi:MAG: helix-turn-helix domain-containing GNAT family N-acetyltransferase [Micavibrio sp.]|nr:helix-turn-helix domain-containing GNAT family N-acetyltransferase [Micavibrio sp.]